MNRFGYLLYNIAIVYGLFHIIFNVLPVLIDSHTIQLWDAVICAFVADHYFCSGSNFNET